VNGQGTPEKCLAEANVTFLNWPADPEAFIEYPDAAALILEISPGPDGNEWAIGTIEAARGHIPVWIYYPGATTAAAAAWIKAGAAEVCTDLAELRTAMDLEERAPQQHASGTKKLVGSSPSMRAVASSIALVADRRCTVLIEGETGTGKEVVAREIHACGSRSRAPWVAINCSAIPEALLEAELFGHTKGAFTGAMQARAGKFEAANHGTIFLDEIGDMPLAVQAKLLRVLQEREVERLGGNERMRLDVRVIAATNVNLAERVKAGLFRQDLFYRLNVFHISLPPLRERTEDIPALARHFVKKICDNEGLKPKTIDSATLRKLAGHSWPGNARELENVMETAVIHSGTRGSIYPCDVRLSEPGRKGPASVENSKITLPPDGIDYQRAMESLEHDLLMQALSRTGGNKAAAAELLGLKRTTLAARVRALTSRRPALV
jgi:transcriptional regulator with GAF, ATPase, and Fis domain